MKEIKGNSGQSTVEYILVLMVVFTLCMTVYRGLGFKDLMGDDSIFFAKLRGYIEFTYQHGTPDKEVISTYDNAHNSYWNGGADTHFFSHKAVYPNGP